MSHELIRRGTRNTFRSLAADIPKAKVELWQNEGFAPVAGLDYDDPSVRRSTVQSYIKAVDQSAPDSRRARVAGVRVAAALAGPPAHPRCE